MSKESDAYAFVIGDLKRQRDEIDRTIARLEALNSGIPVSDTPRGDAESSTQEEQIEETPKDSDFLGMKVIEAAKIVLKQRRKPMSPSAIAAELERGGLLTAGSQTISTMLQRRRNQVGDVVSPKRGVWGLKEWYPRRNFGKSDVTAKNGANETSEPEQPSEQPQIVPLRSDG